MFDNLSVENIKQKIRDGESIRISFQSWRRLLAYWHSYKLQLI